MTHSTGVYVKYLTCCSQGTRHICTHTKQFRYARRCTRTSTKPDLYAQMHNSPRTVRQKLRVHYLVWSLCVSFVRGPALGPEVAACLTLHSGYDNTDS
jgi:hypothetical protein